MLDTGATGVAMPAPVARTLDLKRGRPIATRTAYGTAISYLTRRNSVSVGRVSVGNVDATIAPGLLGKESLLGMSSLKHIEFTQRGDTLILRRY